MMINEAKDSLVQYFQKIFAQLQNSLVCSIEGRGGHTFEILISVHQLLYKTQELHSAGFQCCYKYEREAHNHKPKKGCFE